MVVANIICTLKRILTRFLTRFREDPSDFLNPLLIREVRRSLRENAFISGISLTSTLCLIAVICGVLDAGESSWKNFDYSSSGHSYSSAPMGGNGYAIFGILFLLLWGYSCILIPLNAGKRFQEELGGGKNVTGAKSGGGEGEFDLFMITGIPVWKVISGKLQASLIQLLLVFSVAAPFMVMTYLLRGVSIVTIFQTLILLMMTSLLATQSALFIGSWKEYKWAVSLLMGALSFGMFFLTFGISVLFFSSTGPWGDILFFALPEMLVFLLLAYLASVSHLELPNRNRGGLLKTGVILLFLPGCAWLYFCVDHFPGGSGEGIFMIELFLLSGVLILLSMFLPMKLLHAPLRIQEMFLSYGRWKKCLFAPFYPGRGGYLMFLPIFAFLLLGMEFLFLHFSHGFVASSEYAFSLFIILSVCSFWTFFLGGLLRWLLPKLPVFLISLAALAIPFLASLFVFWMNQAERGSSQEDLLVILCPVVTAESFATKENNACGIACGAVFWLLVFCVGVFFHRKQLLLEAESRNFELLLHGKKDFSPAEEERMPENARRKDGSPPDESRTGAG